MRHFQLLRQFYPVLFLPPDVVFTGARVTPGAKK